MGKTSIEWCDMTWSPVRGCSRVSPGCEHCYAETMAARFGGPGKPFEGFAERTAAGARWTRKVSLIPEMLAAPLRIRQPQRIFVNSMSDLFHESLPFEDVAAVFGVMASASRHTFLVLTKRPARAAEFFAWLEKVANPFGPLWCECLDLAVKAGCPFVQAPADRDAWPLRNVYLGVSVEDQQRAKERVSALLQLPAAKRFISAEPLLEEVDFSRIELVKPVPPDGPGVWLDALGGHLVGPDDMLPARIDQVIVGGESGPGARPFDLAWARSIRDQCQSAGVRFFFKQAGARPLEAWPIEQSPESMVAHGEYDPDPWLRLRDRKGGDLKELPPDLRIWEMID